MTLLPVQRHPNCSKSTNNRCGCISGSHRICNLRAGASASKAIESKDDLFSWCCFDRGVVYPPRDSCSPLSVSS